MKHPLISALEGPHSEKETEICPVFLPRATFNLLVSRATERGVSPAQALADAIRKWLDPQKETS